MAYKKKYTKKKPYKKSKRVRSRKSIVPRGMSGFPNSMTTTLNYQELMVPNSTSGSINNNQFRCNSIFDPNYTSAGHQPLFRDEFQNIYNHYQIVSSYITVTYSNKSTLYGGLVGLNIDDDATMSTTRETLCEQNNAKFTYLTPLGGSKSTCKLTKKWSAKKIIGRSMSDDLRGSSTTNPLEESYFNAWVACYEAQTTTFDVLVSIKFNVRFTELKTPTQS